MGEISGFLLTRHWRNTQHGIELDYWLAAEDGPACLRFTEQQSVCFIDRDATLSLPAGTRRRPLELRNLRGEAVDGLYFNDHRKLNELRQIAPRLHESDIKPADRFLMERFVRAGIRATGQIETIDRHRLLVNPRIAPIDIEPSLHVMAIDIETRANSQQLYSIASSSMHDDEQSVVFMVGQGKDTARDGYTLHFRDTEREVLSSWFDWICAADPDVISGWAVVNFDLDFLDRKCRSLGLPFLIGRGGESATVLQPGNPGSPRVARVPGRAVLDGIDLLRAGFWNFESFSLDNVSHELLGTGKLIGHEHDKVAEINRRYHKDKPALADYNVLDCKLVNRIFEKASLLPFAMERAQLTGLALDRTGGSVAAFDNLYLPRLHRRGFVADDIGQGDTGTTSPGGYVMESVPGLFRNVLLLDFKSLYPSIIRTFLIDPLGLALAELEDDNANPVPGFVGAQFSRSNPILPEVIETLWAARDAARQNRNAPLSQAIKIIMNSFYGVLGSSGCRFYSPKLASSITRRGHEVINRTREWIETEGHQVIYGDTDSVFVLPAQAKSHEECLAFGATLAAELNARWKQVIEQEFALESFLELEFETLYSRFFMPTMRGTTTGSKKRYAGIVRKGDAQSPELVVKGLEAVRTDWTPLARNFQRELLTRVFADREVVDFVRSTREALHAGELDDQLVYRKRLRRDLSDYQRNVPPHVQAARKLGRRGSSISYVITVNGPEPLEKIASAPDYDHYEERQLAPAADGILQCLDTSFAAINDKQMKMF